MRVLIIDDDPAFCEVTTLALESAGYEPSSANSVEDGLACVAAASAGHFDALLLDVNLPESSGWELLAALREAQNPVPVLFVTSCTDLEDRVHGLRLGADDYITKPIEYEELIARIESVVRRSRSLPTLEYGALSIDLAKRHVTCSGASVDLSPREYDVLLMLVQADGQSVSRKQLLEEIWKITFEPGTNVINVHIARLRRKLEAAGCHMIETERGEGYRAVRQEG